MTSLVNEEWGNYDPGEFTSKYLFKHPEFNKEFDLSSLVDKDIGLVFENMDPYITLRILAENPANDDYSVQWGYSDVVDGGWADKDDLIEPLSDADKILIVTEGSSDSFIISRALELLCPDIVDFFYFVDMEEHYPFTGTGNLYRFCQGLASIRIQNNVLIVYDNDVAGINKYTQTKTLSLPSNMRIARLPDNDSFNSIETLGPNGTTSENINGSAVAIECFLDLNYRVNSAPTIRWTSYDSNLGKYQGELVNKDAYVREFKKIRPTECDYNFDKLNSLVDHLYREWVSEGV